MDFDEVQKIGDSAEVIAETDNSRKIDTKVETNKLAKPTVREVTKIT